MRSLRVLFEVFSAIFVITALITLIYSEYRLARAIAGVAMVFLVSAATTSLVLRMERRDP
jgi:uncharacterized membrane protein YqjE